MNTSLKKVVLTRMGWIVDLTSAVSLSHPSPFSSKASYPSSSHDLHIAGSLLFHGILEWLLPFLVSCWKRQVLRHLKWESKIKGGSTILKWGVNFCNNVREIKCYFNIWKIRKKGRMGLRKRGWGGGGGKFTHFTSPGSVPENIEQVLETQLTQFSVLLYDNRILLVKESQYLIPRFYCFCVVSFLLGYQ